MKKPILLHTCILLCLILKVGLNAQNIPEPFKLALLQMKVIGGDREKNLTHAGTMIAEAAEKGADFILLPEAMDLGWTDPSALTEAESVPEGKTCQFLASCAKKNHLYICSGLIEKSGDQVFNSAVVLDPQGDMEGGI